MLLPNYNQPSHLHSTVHCVHCSALCALHCALCTTLFIEWDLEWSRGKEVTSVGIESGAMEGDRRLVGGREEEEGDCQKVGSSRAEQGL